jgi:hypothetical protein
MSKVVSKLVKLAVVSSTLAVLGTTIAMPVAYANRNDAENYCHYLYGGSISYNDDRGTYTCAYREGNNVQFVTVPDEVAKH